MREKIVKLYTYSELSDEAKAKARDWYRGLVSQDHNVEARAFMDWIYKQLETDYNYRNSDDAIAEGIRANEYEFTEDGKVESQN